MNVKSLIAATAVAAAASTSAMAGGGNLGSLPPSASFSNTVAGAFTDVWTFNLGSTSAVAASITNVEISFGGPSFGGILGFAATLNGTPLLLSSSTQNLNPLTITTQVLAGAGTLPAGVYQLVVSGTGITGATASYGGNIVAAPVPEPESYAMLLAGLGVMGAIAMRRNKAKKD